MTIEEKLKDYILTRHKSLRAFVAETNVGLPYTTVDGMLKRGIASASVANVTAICKALGISADELAHGRITPTAENRTTDVARIAYLLRLQDLTLDGQPLTKEEAATIMDALEIGVGIVRRRRG